MDAQRSREIDPYAVLQVAREADAEVIAAAYRALARRFHPDVAGDRGTDRMRTINAAWEILRSPERRAAFDRQQRAAGSGASTAPAATHAAGGRPTGRPGPRHAGEWRHGAPGTGAAGPPPGRPSGSVLPFGRHIGWSLGEIARADPGYLEWLAERPEGAPYRSEIDGILERLGRRPASGPTARARPGLWRRG